MGHRFALATVSLTLLSAAVGGCGASTKYVPARAGHLYLVQKDGHLSYQKTGQVVPVQTSDATTLVSCTAPAARLAATAADEASTARTLYTLGPYFGLIGAIITAPLAAKHQSEANAASLDALHAHNNEAACIGPESKAYSAVTKPVEGAL